jgi:hypothetical protein
MRVDLLSVATPGGSSCYRGELGEARQAPPVLAIEIDPQHVTPDIIFRLPLSATGCPAMSTALLSILLLSAHPSSGCCSGVESSQSLHGLREKWDCHAGYYKRLYYGHFDRHPFDYRFQFDYPWHAGPSQPHWPIPPLSAAELAPWEETVPWTGQRASPRVSIAPGEPRADVKPTASRASLLFRRAN